jgi:PAS domain S-box-containing protein
VGLVEELAALDGDLAAALELVGVPSYVAGPTGVILWLNGAGHRLFGDVEGRQYTSVVAPEDVRRARERFARNILGRERVADQEFTVIAADGRRLKVEVSSVPLSEGHHLVGIFGQVADVEEADEKAPHPALTPRQVEVLRLLEQGRSTQQIADELHLTVETVRNHVRRLLRTLGVHSRLEAVALARRGSRPQ